MASVRLYLGTHQPDWLGRLEVPLFVSRRRLARRRTLPRARVGWALDSGGFSELSLYGTWTVTPAQYAAEVSRYQSEVGQLEWAAIQDWMCEPCVLERTALTVEEHQHRTVESYSRLLELAPDLPWRPVLQGWRRDDYLRCVDLYQRAGHDLANAPLVGVGSICRRQSTREAERIIRDLAGLGLRLHGFGFKRLGLRRVGALLATGDTMAWSDEARKEHVRLAGCAHGKLRWRERVQRHDWGNCANCPRFALQWYQQLQREVDLA